MMRRRILIILLLLLGLGVWQTSVVMAEECGTNETDPDKIDRCIGDLQRDLTASVVATTPLESEISKLDSRIKSLQANITAAVKKQKALEISIDDSEQKIAEHYVILAKKTEELYKKLRQRSILTQLLSSVGSGQLGREIGYQSRASDMDRQLIIGFSSEIIGLENDKKTLEAQNVKLAALQGNLNRQVDFFKGEVAKAKKYQQDLSGKIAVLSARQQEILGEKQSTFSTTVGDVPLADDPNSRPDYNPGFSPAFAVFSFGAPHFKGMSQYGAYGRAKLGQNVEAILSTYYGGIEIKKDYPADKVIRVSGYGSMDIETYMKRVYEVPNSWGDNGGFEALKAQAVAARSYALAWTDEGRGGAICTTEACQVYKNANKGGKWEEAVAATRGWVLVANGKPFKAWYASTSGGYQSSYTDGGYTTPSLWDAVGGRGGWTSQAYEKIAGSPWFYKGWYKSRSGASCNRNHPWLNGEEMADILNAWVVLVKNGQSDDRIVPLGGCAGGNPYSISELREKASGMSGGYSGVSGVSVTYSDGGFTANVHFETNKGGVDMSGDDFKKAFNLRAPGWISVKSRLFNIERK